MVFDYKIEEQMKLKKLLNKDKTLTKEEAEKIKESIKKFRKDFDFR